MRRVLPIFAGLLLLSLPVSARSSASANWSSVTSLPPGTEVEVGRQSGSTVRGTITSSSDTGLILANDHSSVSVERQNVTDVYRLSKRHVLRGALIGGAVGVGTGAVLGAAVCGSNSFANRSKCVPVAAGVLGGAGVVIGGAIGKGRRHKELIYRGNLATATGTR